MATERTSETLILWLEADSFDFGQATSGAIEGRDFQIWHSHLGSGYSATGSTGGGTLEIDSVSVIPMEGTTSGNEIWFDYDGFG